MNAADALVRRTDPDESHDAAAKLPQDCEYRVLGALVRLRSQGFHGGTAHQITDELCAHDPVWKPKENSVHRRITSLKRRGWVEPTGERRDGQAVIAPTVLGRIALDRQPQGGEQ